VFFAVGRFRGSRCGPSRYYAQSIPSPRGTAFVSPLQEPLVALSYTVVFEFSLTSHSLRLIPGNYIRDTLNLYGVTALLVGQNYGGNDCNMTQDVL
jgi:hypothetical protein